jgi:hypothetical protein
LKLAVDNVNGATLQNVTMKHGFPPKVLTLQPNDTIERVISYGDTLAVIVLECVSPVLPSIVTQRGISTTKSLFFGIFIDQPRFNCVDHPITHRTVPFINILHFWNSQHPLSTQ